MGRPALVEEQEVGVAPDIDRSSLASVLHSPLQRLVDLLAHGDSAAHPFWSWARPHSSRARCPAGAGGPHGYSGFQNPDPLSIRTARKRGGPVPSRMMISSQYFCFPWCKLRWEGFFCISSSTFFTAFWSRSAVHLAGLHREGDYALGDFLLHLHHLRSPPPYISWLTREV